MYDCKAYDARGRGVLHLVVGNGDASRFQLPHDPSLVAPQALDASTPTLVNLQTLYFYIRADNAARIMATELIADRIRYNRGVPIEACFSEDIVFLGNDPRRIEHDLRLVCVGDDPRASLWVWQEMLRSFGIGEVAPDTPARVADAVYAAGFWLVDADAFGAMPERAGFFGQGPRSTTYRWDMKHDATLTAHRPQLGLFTLDP
ncbi:hypothetical protein SCUCBS95973_003303 [Sporothrix curviconia]|uniref:Uncharacterized protein n=1 Tax=Sporothrix curviconia TaxID=1260050 RepID=A0ABP0BEB2_9PEZI